ncbi:esterase-like activity of phytase family protein [Solihabitans fulvus]|uniref:Esterase-like activity of phytase family protein n=1 Tax=Solihabitans fulvus TaxID=1892852 RepID=A0A5B2WY72_9PSEU|nr:esterase-like activity of phytase family protein [Solihabitans fulvus]KAA2255652.1 esterase-like activity of phytase family protein [Solihabitans fulvus]
MFRRSMAAATIALAATTLTIGTAAAEASPAAHPVVSAPGYDFTLLGSANLPGWVNYQGTRVGGFSGIDYDAASGTWYALSSDRSDHQSARFYSARFDLSSLNPDSAGPFDVSTLLRQDGTPFPPSDQAGADLVDPQAIRFDAASGNVVWASAGTRTQPAPADPSVRVAKTDGSFVSQYRVPDVLKPAADGSGLRDGGGLHGLAMTADGKRVLTAMRTSLAQDGPEVGGPVRLTLHDRGTGNPLVQYAYQPEAVAGNGVAEILSVSANRFLVLEQAGQNSAKLYEVNFASGASNVLAVPSLAGATYRPVSKRLVLDVSKLGLSSVDNLQGMTWGPALDGGDRSLVLVSDNQLQSRKCSQFIAVRVHLS